MNIRGIPPAQLNLFYCLTGVVIILQNFRMGLTDQPPTPDPLTPREVEVLGFVAKGMQNPEIAEHLVITEATVRTHVSNIMTKLHLASRTQAALYALREGLATLDSE